MNLYELKQSFLKDQRGNAKIAGLVVLSVIAIGALAYLSGHLAQEQDTSATEIELTASDDAETGASGIKPGNPVVGSIDGEPIYRSEVAKYMKALPPQMQQLPLGELFPAALNQVVNEKLVRIHSRDSGLEGDPKVQEQLKAAKEEIIATIYLQNQLDKAVDEDKLDEAYQDYLKTVEPVEEVKASHILVKTEAEAQALINKLEKGADFAELAKENSIDKGSAERGGDIGYFSRADVVAEFADAAFTQETGKTSFAPVESQFGYHVIKVEDKRERPAPTLEEARPFLETRLRQETMQALFDEWRSNADIVMKDFNGETIEPAAGIADEAAMSNEEAPAAQDQPEEASSETPEAK